MDHSRKRSHERGALDQPVHKRKRPSSVASDSLPERRVSESGDGNNPIDYWRINLHWPQQFFEPGSNMSHLLGRGKSTSASRPLSSASSIDSTSAVPTPSDERPREEKSAPYRDLRYTILLAARGSFMEEDDVGIGREAKQKCMALLSEDQTVPEHSLFSDRLFRSTCRMIREKNEARVIRDISLLLVPSAETLNTYGATNLECLVESTNEGWNNSIPITSPRPQPDYSVGFRREAFTTDQIKLLQPFIGTLWDSSYFVATWYMYFPFLICEVNCRALDVADRQNAHGATVAVRTVVELFRLVEREKELNRQILAFSISHNYRAVRIYGHYPIIDDGESTKYYRYLIHSFDFTDQEGKKRWTTYKFTKNVYDNWMPDHFARIRSAVDMIPPGISFDVSEESELHFSQTGPSQDLESPCLSRSAGSASAAGHDSASSVVDDENTTPDTSAPQAFKEIRRL